MQSLEDLSTVLPFLKRAENGVYCAGRLQNTTWVFDRREIDPDAHWNGDGSFDLYL